ncbi:MAG: ZIP family metal transporter [Candidatus Saccharimonadales bacterium]
MENSFIVLFWSLVGGVLSLVGGVLLLKSTSRRETLAKWALPFGAGALLAAAFFDLLPEALHQEDAASVLPWVLGGFLAFFVLERTVHWFHRHHDHSDEGREQGRNTAQKSLIIFGDTIHNLIDGIGIGAAFLIDVPTGIITALAVAAHEIPQEIGDFGFLLSRGMSAKNTILVNVVSSLATVIGALAVYLLGSNMTIPLAPILALTAGFFIYIAASDIIPDIHERPHKEANQQAGMLVLGVVIVALMISVLTHGYDSDDHHRGCYDNATEDMVCD